MSDEHLDIIDTPACLLADVQSMIEQTRAGVAQAINAGMTSLYWRIGKRIQNEILQGQRADYGKEIVATLSRQLASKFGTGFSEKNLRRMIQFAEVFPDPEIVVSLIRQLSWTHILALILSLPSDWKISKLAKAPESRASFVAVLASWQSSSGCHRRPR